MPDLSKLAGLVGMGASGYAGRGGQVESLRRKLQEREEERQRKEAEAAGMSAKAGSDAASPSALRELQRRKASEDFERARRELEEQKRRLALRAGWNYYSGGG